MNQHINEADATVKQLRPKPRPNAITEETGVDAARRLFRTNGWVFQEIEERNDFGKDAYVDLPEEDGLTGITLALQIKSGLSFKRKDGYSIPVAQHRLVWIESTVPVFGVVHDCESSDLYWVNITQYLRDRIGSDVHQVLIPPTQVLNSTTLNTQFRDAAYAAWDITQGAVFLLNLIHSDDALQMSAVYDCLSLAQHEPRFIVLLRGCLKQFRGDALRAALWILGHFVPARRLWREDMAWMREARRTNPPFAHLNAEEIVFIMEQMEDDDWEEAQSVNELLWLITNDPIGLLKLKHVLELALATGLNRVAEGILEIICFLANEDGLDRYHEVLSSIPGVAGLPSTPELVQGLEEHGSLYLFSFAVDALVRDAGQIGRVWPTST